MIYAKSCRLAGLGKYDGAVCSGRFQSGAKSRVNWARSDYSDGSRKPICIGRISKAAVYQWFPAINDCKRQLLRQCDGRELFSRFKTELIEGGIFESVDQARSENFSYIKGDYNRIRRHSSLGYLSPMDFEKQLKIKNQRSSESFLSCFS